MTFNVEQPMIVVLTKAKERVAFVPKVVMPTKVALKAISAKRPFRSTKSLVYSVYLKQPVA